MRIKPLENTTTSETAMTAPTSNPFTPKLGTGASARVGRDSAVAFISHTRFPDFGWATAEGRARWLLRPVPKRRQHTLETPRQHSAVEMRSDVALAICPQLPTELGVVGEFQHGSTQAGRAFGLDDESRLALLHYLARLSADTQDDGPAHRHALKDLRGDYGLEQRQLAQQHQARIRQRPDLRHALLGLLLEHRHVGETELLAQSEQSLTLGAIAYEQKGDVGVAPQLCRGIQHGLESVGHTVRADIGK